MAARRPSGVEPFMPMGRSLIRESVRFSTRDLWAWRTASSAPVDAPGRADRRRAVLRPPGPWPLRRPPRPDKHPIMKRSRALKPLSSEHHQALLVAFQLKKGLAGHAEAAGAPKDLPGLLQLARRFEEQILRTHCPGRGGAPRAVPAGGRHGAPAERARRDDAAPRALADGAPGRPARPPRRLRRAPRAPRPVGGARAVPVRRGPRRRGDARVESAASSRSGSCSPAPRRSPPGRGSRSFGLGPLRRSARRPPRAPSPGPCPGRASSSARTARRTAAGRPS